ncbi:MAG: tellurite resistance TerB family protein [Polyangiaceae bacterium]
MTAPDEDLLERVANKLSLPPSYAEEGTKSSILTVAAASYGAKPTTDDITQPTGFDPDAAALFEAVVEAAFLVANADGDFDATERATFEHVVLSACEGVVGQGQVHALIADLEDLMHEDGIDKRVQMVARTVTRPEHAQEVLRVAALLAHVSGGVSDVERDVLDKLTQAFEASDDALQRALSEAQQALAE